jgi:iron complex transport system permease protein
LATVLLALALAFLGALRLHLPPTDISGTRLNSTVIELRMATLSVTVLVGAGLAVAGLLMQGLFRNPLAEPGLLGVGSGANLGGMLSMSLVTSSTGLGLLGVPPELFMAVGCIAGALSALAVLSLASRRRLDAGTVLLTGVALTSLFGSVAAVFRAIVSDHWELSRALLHFSMGDISGKGWRHSLFGVPLIAGGTAAALLLARRLDLLSTGEEEAATLGVDVARLRRWVIVWTSLLVAATVAIGGGVPFVGLLVPHAMRRLVGFRHLTLVPLTALGGGVLLVGCDCLTILIGLRSTVPLGGITGLLGAPVFLYLLRQHAHTSAQGG